MQVIGKVKVPDSGWLSTPSDHGWYLPEDLDDVWSYEPDIVNSDFGEGDQDDADAGDSSAAAEEIAAIFEAFFPASPPQPSQIPPPRVMMPPPAPPPPVVVVIEEEEEEEIPAEIDTTPPVCELLSTPFGQSAMAYLDMFDQEFSDPGIKCLDKGDILLGSQITRRVEFFDGDGWSPAREVNNRIAPAVFRILYEAVDGSENRAQMYRTVSYHDCSFVFCF